MIFMMTGVSMAKSKKIIRHAENETIEMNNKNIMSLNSSSSIIRVSPEQFCKVFNKQTLRVIHQKAPGNDEPVFHKTPLISVWQDGNIVHIGDDVVVDSNALALRTTIVINGFLEEFFKERDNHCGPMSRFSTS